MMMPIILAILAFFIASKYIGKASVKNERKLPPSRFDEAINKASIDMNINPSDLKLIINSESGFNSKAVNKQSNAVGIIQFMPDTLEYLGYDFNQVYNMTFEQQLDLAKKYYKIFIPKGTDNVYDLYLATFYPYAIGKPDSFVLGSEVSKDRANKIGMQNKGINKGYNISVGDFKRFINNKKLKK